MIKIQEINTNNFNGRKRKYKAEGPTRRVTDDFLQGLIDDKVAVDISDKDWDAIKDKVFNVIYFTSGPSGIDGCAFLDEDGVMYIVRENLSTIHKIFQENSQI